MIKKLINFLTFIFILVNQAHAIDLSVLDQIKQSVRTHTYDNGLKIIIYPRSQAPVSTGMITVGVGGVDEVPGETGIAHVLEHMAFKGTKTLGTKDYAKEAPLLLEIEEIILASNDGNDLSKEQEARIAELREELSEIWDPETNIDKLYLKLGGVGLNATTSADLTNYFINLPSNAFDAWCALEADRLKEPVWRQFYKERDVVQQERRMRYVDNPGGYLYSKIIANSFTVHPYRTPTIGYDQDLQHLTASKTDEFFRKYYVANNLVVTLVGDLDPDYAIKKVGECFGDLRTNPSLSRPHLVEPAQNGEKLMTVKFSAEPQMAISYHKPRYPSREDVALNIWMELLMGSRTAPVYKDLVIDRQIATSLSYSEGPGALYDNLYLISARPQKPYSNQQLLEALDSSMARELGKAISKKKLAEVKRGFQVDFISGLASNQGMASHISYSEAVYGSWEYFYSWMDMLEDMGPDEIKAAAKKYLKKSNRTVVKLERETIENHKVEVK